jgi:hypothetical protein
MAGYIQNVCAEYIRICVCMGYIENRVVRNDEIHVINLEKILALFHVCFFHQKCGFLLNHSYCILSLHSDSIKGSFCGLLRFKYILEG